MSVVLIDNSHSSPLRLFEREAALLGARRLGAEASMLHHRGALIQDENGAGEHLGAMMHALAGARMHDPNQRSGKIAGLPVFKPKVPASQILEAVKVIQKMQRSKAAHTLYNDARKEIEEAKLFFQRVRSSAGVQLTSEDLKTRTIARSKAAYAMDPEHQLEIFEQAMRLAQDARDEAEVNAYLKSKAENAQQHHNVIKPKVAHSSLDYYALRIQTVARHFIARRRHELLASTALHTLEESKLLYQRAGHDPRRDDANLPPRPFSPSPMSSAQPGSRPVSPPLEVDLKASRPAGRNVMAGVRLTPEDRAAVVAAALEHAKEQADVKGYDAWKRERAAVAHGPRAVAKIKPSTLNSMARKIQWQIRHHLAVKHMGESVAKWHDTSDKIFAMRQRPVVQKPRLASKETAERAYAGARSPRQQHQHETHGSSTEEPPSSQPEKQPARAVDIAEAAWFEDHVVVLEGFLSDMVQLLAETRPHDPVRFMAKYLTRTYSDEPRVPDEIAEQEWMAEHRTTIEQQISKFVRAAAIERTKDPVAFLAAKFGVPP